jgi:hypothetical protein
LPHTRQLPEDLAVIVSTVLASPRGRAGRTAQRDRIRERVSQVKADQRARGLFGGGVPFGYRRGGKVAGCWCRIRPSRRAVKEMAPCGRKGRR